MAEVGELEAPARGIAVGVSEDAESPGPAADYAEVDVPEVEPAEADGSEDLETAMRYLLADAPADTAAAEAAAQPALQRHPEVVDDFIRNFLVKSGLTTTLDAFEAEWYERKAAGTLPAALAAGPVPDAYVHNAALADDCAALRAQLEHARGVAAKAAATWGALRKERDVHRMHHKRVAQEKGRLVKELKQLRDHYSKYEPALEALRRKYEAAMREKALTALERDRLRDRLSELKATQRGGGDEGGVKQGEIGDEGDGAEEEHETIKAHTPPTASGARQPAQARSTSDSGRAASLPSAPRNNPFRGVEFEEMALQGRRPEQTVKGHTLGVAHVAVHPRKPVLATASDDHTWRLWHVPDGELIMSGEGHNDWVGGVAFHPCGALLASASGDATVKLWDFTAQACVATLKEHTAAAWAVAWHDQGEFLASSSLDRSVRLWDAATGTCKLALRGHADSVNECAWLPFTNTLATASSDKTVSLWDARAGLCVATFYGHGSSINSVACALDAYTVASVDADGHAKVWDVRAVAERAGAKIAPHGLARAAFDRSGYVLAAACDDGAVYGVYSSDLAKDAGTLTGHDDAAQAVAFDPNGEFIVTGASDCTFKVWR